ncbi:CDP-diacylglycerol--glycerol-3-phosphate 3-phosphatidyltransferase [Fasciola hepatica]|uniref:CDP-diacylglycerol--glycerol-3-phosphate 3-phosphatidyltransferase n=1 Tax=Fasciola hepatica TaxID=6192 RepID=A0A4E0RE56_FASHE|nr:CDP-diacylglycerol--glycerol-3-phosphate 3-phosphatidyltransferase [Fasciola hepatica]
MFNCLLILYHFLRRFQPTMLSLIERCNLPLFPIGPQQISILQSPQEFYNVLLNQIRQAKRRIVLSTLYIGTGYMEVQLVNAVKQAASERKLQVDVLIDSSRGLRCSSLTHQYLGRHQIQPSSFAKASLESSQNGSIGEYTSSADLLTSLADVPGVSVYLYHNPRLRGWLQYMLPSRLNEVLGVQHIKAYVFDDSVILSGANLSHEYFVSRQDRAWLFNRFSPLADFYSGLIKVIGQFCYRLFPDGSLRVASTATDPVITPLNLFETRFRVALGQYMSDFQTRFPPDRIQSGQSTLICPLVQCGPYGIHNEKQFTTELLRHVISDTEHHYDMALASGYFNLTDSYAKLLAEFITYQRLSKLTLLCASPTANGFLNSRGLSGYIPMAYRESLIKLLNQFGSLAGQITCPTVFEYSRPSWTFHAKGMWFEQKTRCDQLGTSFTLVGSSNFSYRSLNRDLESQVAVWTTDPNLQTQIQIERNNLFNATYIQPVLLSQLVTQTQYRLPWYMRLLHPILYTFM